jgi:RimJ/RimL family protein N-acetyltransferase
MIRFPDNLFLEDRRALLRPLQSSDLNFLLPFALQEPDIWPFSHPAPAGAEAMEAYINFTVGQRQLQREYPFIIFDKLSQRYAGCTRFYDIQLGNLSSQLGYTWYGKEFQRTGLNRHCKWLLLSFAFESWGLERVEFRADTRNARSIRAMKEIGCTEEGVLRSTGPSGPPGRRDAIVLSILKNEWFTRVRENLAKKIYD